MLVRFWGVRGSIPAPITKEQEREKIEEILKRASYSKLETEDDINSFINGLPFYLRAKYGGNTTCIEINDEQGNLFIIDAGSGIRLLGLDLFRRKPMPKTVHIFLTHFHWDHIQGFPFFGPAYLPDVKIIFHSTRKDVKELIIKQQVFDNFPKGIF